ncbi:MAG: preprotein translocase subunit SecG [Betaproteobacteria bacterium]
MLANLVLIVHVIVALSIVVLVLLQHGKGADMGAAFGSGSAGSLFGASGAANFLSRATGVCAGIFFVTCLALTYFHAPKAATGVMGGGVMQDMVPAKDGGANSIPVPGAPATTPATAPAAAPATPDAVPAQGESKSPQIPK